MTTILEDLRYGQLNNTIRRALLLDAARHAELLDTTHRAELLEDYADPRISGGLQSALFRELTDAVRTYYDIKNFQPSWVRDSDGLTKEEALEAQSQRIEEALGGLLPVEAKQVEPEPAYPAGSERDALLRAMAHEARHAPHRPDDTARKTA